MPQKDSKGRYCGVVDIEEKEKSTKFVRRYLRLDKAKGVVEWFTDNPSTLPDHSQPQGTIDINFITKVDIPAKLKFKAKHCFFIHTPPRRYYFQGINDEDMREWVDILDGASKIVVSSDDESVDAQTTKSPNHSNKENTTKTEDYGYTTEIVAGVIIQKKMPTATEDHSAPAEDLKFLRTLSLPHGGSPRRLSALSGKVLKKGWAVKQGHLRKNWKRRYFVVTTRGFSYFHSDQDKEPIRSIPVTAILTAKVDTSPLSENRDNLFLVATMERKYYIQADDKEDMTDWIKAFRDAIHHSGSVRRRSKDLSSNTPAELHHGDTSSPAVTTRKLDMSLSLAPQAQRNSSYLGNTPSPSVASNRLSCAGEAFYTRPTSVTGSGRNLRNASSSEDSSGLGGSVDSLSGPGIDLRPLIKQEPSKRHSRNLEKNNKSCRRSTSGSEFLTQNTSATPPIAMPDIQKYALPRSPSQGSSRNSIPRSISNTSSLRSSGSFSPAQSPRTSKLILDPKVDHRAAVKPSTVKRKKNTGTLFSLNNMLKKKAEKMSSEKEREKYK